MAGVEYYFNNLDHATFQRLINSILIARFGEHARLTPLHGSDGGRDGETAPYNPYFEFQVHEVQVPQVGIILPPQKGRYLFQVKYHLTINTRLSDARRTVLSEFEEELKNNVINRQGQEQVNYFFLITNVPSSQKALAEVDKRAVELRKTFPHLYVDIWWEEKVKAFLDQMPTLWNSFPNLFAGGKVPFLGNVTEQNNSGLPRAVRIAIDRQYMRDSSIKFRQIGLEKNLSKLFTGLDIDIRHLSVEEQREVTLLNYKRERFLEEPMDEDNLEDRYYPHQCISALKLLLNETSSTTRKIILEGGPGQGKSTVTQVLTQIYRQQLLGKNDMDPEGRWIPPQKSRHPLRIELRKFAEWLSKKSGESIEEYLAFVIKQDAGGSPVTVDDIYNIVEGSYVILILDGLDEVGSDDLRNEVLIKIAESIYRFENNLNVDLRVIITTRPPSVTNCTEYLTDFKRFPIASMTPTRIKQYVKRWLTVQLNDEDERKEVKESFEKRQNEPHVQALAKNPMQLSVLLHFIRFKGIAFPDRRAELYRDYFRTVIDRDVEKSSSLREQRETIESLHQFLGYKIHALTEVEQADGSLTYPQLLGLVESWLTSRGGTTKTAHELFKIGQERLGLIVALKGEGGETRYGYEIQPIREYFAAAFINDDIQGNAHDVFQVMVQRPYWREVALFLAGLRRPNEKADLIARAKALDIEKELGWRQDGRSLILQLLQEGIFSQPPHLFSDALDFVFDALDPSIVKIQNEPKELLKILPGLIKQEETKNRYIDRLAKLVQEYRTSEDEYIIYRLYYIISQILDQEKITKELLLYQGHNPNILAKVRLFWPSIWRVNINRAILDPSYWDGVPDQIWSDTLGYAMSRFNTFSIFQSLPPRFHKCLLEQFAIHSTYSEEGLYGFSGMASTGSNPVWAIGVLFNYQRMFAFLQHFPEENINLLEKRLDNLLTENNVSSINYIGLSDDERSIVGDLIAISREILEAAIAGQDELSNAFEDYSCTIKKYLRQPGLTSWLACRCALNLLFNTFLRGRSFPSSLWEPDSWKSLWKELKSFFPKRLLPSENIDEEIELTSFLHSIIGTPFLIPNAAPEYVRLGYDSELVDLVDIFTSYICEGKELPFDWIKGIPLTRMILPLTERCSNCLPTLLAAIDDTPLIPFVSKQVPATLDMEIAIPFTRFDFDAPLSAVGIQRILKVVRNTDDPKILSGGLIALSSSKYLRSAGPDLTLKMVRAASNKGDIVMHLFDQRLSRGLDAVSRNIIDEIAKGILEYPNDYTFLVTCAAAEHLAGYSPVGLTPLLSMEEKLNLHVSTK